MLFQSTLPRGERRNIWFRTLMFLRFQSTLPRGERLCKRLQLLGTVIISIHAPARGATFYNLLSSFRITDFNPRSREGSDWLYISAFSILSNFNPRSREGSDIRQSTPSNILTEFQSTLPRGERRSKSRYRRNSKRFQSTLPRGERLEWIKLSPVQCDFNPRSREGSDDV